MFKNLAIGDTLRRAFMLIAQAMERCHQLFTTVNKDTAMWSSNILDYHAHWLLIAHNPRNNKRTKRKK